MIEDVIYGFATPLLSLMLLGIIFSPLEKCFPAQRQKIFRPGWLTDLCFFLGQYLLWGGLVFGFLAWCAPWITGVVPASFRAMVHSQPWWLQAVGVMLLSDFLIYWGHPPKRHRFDARAIKP
jgi:sterol desaturase/sphingolipid hydroxylase (fatty acid hydroxylase superfamily)